VCYHGGDLGVELTYIGCEGVLVRSRSGAVLIDGLFGPEAAGFHIPPASQLEAVQAARPPYGGVDIALATHFHEDHFDPAVVAAYLRASARTWFLSTPQAVELLVVNAPDLAPRTVAVAAPEGVRVARDFGGLRVEAFGLSHGKVNYGDVQHLGFVVTMDGSNVVHLGDGIIDEKSLRRAGLLDAMIDVGVLPFWFLTYPFGKRLVARAFRPRAIFACHIRVHEREQVQNDIAAWIPAAVPLVEPLAVYEIDDEGNIRRKE
jgi:L-ascorbate metabolism protein UlaG (beta-lactamase superfamily)